MRLKPLTIGHRLLLHDIRSPFILQKDQFRKSDLQLAVLVCAQPYPEALKTFRSGDLPFTVALFAATIWRWAVAKCDTAAEARSLIRYLNAQQDFPRIQEKNKDHEYRTINAPMDWILIRFLMKIGECRSSYEAMNYPVLRAHALWATDGDLEGNRPLHNANSPGASNEIRDFWEACRREDDKLYGSI